jgi:parvulin-like peptidyl-prolyl isomerase
MRLGSLVLACCIGLAAAAPAGCQPEPADAVARVDDETIEADEFRSRYVAYLLATGLSDEQRHRLHVANTMIAERLLVRDAREAGLTSTPAYGEAIERIRQKLLVEAYVQRMAYDTIQVGEAELEGWYARSRTHVEARHLYARTPEEAHALRDRLAGGETFESLAREVFADTLLANSGGALGPFAMDEMDPAFEEAAYTLPIGVVSPPVRTQTGYSILRVDRRETDPVLTEYDFATRRDRLLHYATYRRKIAARAALARRLAEELAPAYVEASVDRLLDQIAGTPDRLETGEAASAWLDAPLVTFGPERARASWTIARFREAARFTSEAQRVAVKDRASLLAFIEGLLVREAMIREAERLRVDRDSAYTQAFAAAERDWVREEALRALARNTPVPEDSIASYLHRYRHEFVEPARVHVGEILVDQKTEADSLRAGLTPETFADVARRYSRRPGAAATGGDLGFVSAEQLGVMAGPVFEAPSGRVLGPLEVQGRYVLFLVGERREAHSMSAEEARPFVEERLRREAFDRSLQEHIARSRAGSDISIDEGRLLTLPLKKTPA